jgi:thiol-disulfide isomerase/thioredoxin
MMDGQAVRDTFRLTTIHGSRGPMADLPRALGVAAIALVVAACATAPAASPARVPTEAPPTDLASPTSTTRPAASPEPSAPGTPVASADALVELTQAWATASLTDVSTGETFSIADHAGDVIIVETMAIWCSNCRAQQHEVQAALARLPADRVVYVVVDVDPNEDAASLAEYRVDNGFDGRYAIAGTDLARALAGDFGDQFLNPPSTPMLIVGTDGTVTQTEFGHKSADELVALAQAHGA